MNTAPKASTPARRRGFFVPGDPMSDLPSAQHRIKREVTIGDLVHILVLVAGGIGMYFTLDTQVQLQDQRQDAHETLGAHSAADQAIRQLTRNVDRLVLVSEATMEDVQEVDSELDGVKSEVARSSERIRNLERAVDRDDP